MSRPVRKIFGSQRQRRGTHNNPNAQEFLKNTQAYREFNKVTKGPAGKTVVVLHNSSVNIDEEREQASTKKAYK